MGGIQNDRGFPHVISPIHILSSSPPFSFCPPLLFLCFSLLLSFLLCYDPNDHRGGTTQDGGRGARRIGRNIIWIRMRRTIIDTTMTRWDCRTPTTITSTIFLFLLLTIVTINSATSPTTLSHAVDGGRGGGCSGKGRIRGAGRRGGGGCMTFIVGFLSFCCIIPLPSPFLRVTFDGHVQFLLVQPFHRFYGEIMIIAIIVVVVLGDHGGRRRRAGSGSKR